MRGNKIKTVFSICSRFRSWSQSHLFKFYFLSGPISISRRVVSLKTELGCAKTSPESPWGSWDTSWGHSCRGRSPSSCSASRTLDPPPLKSQFYMHSKSSQKPLIILHFLPKNRLRIQIYVLLPPIILDWKAECMKANSTVAPPDRDSADREQRRWWGWWCTAPQSVPTLIVAWNAYECVKKQSLPTQSEPSGRPTRCRWRCRPGSLWSVQRPDGPPCPTWIWSREPWNISLIQNSSLNSRLIDCFPLQSR